MRLQISHRTVYRYERPVKSIVQMLRLTPRNHNGQYVLNWRVDVSENCVMQQQEDAFGNVTHVLTVESAASELQIMVDGEVETQDMQGVVGGAVERFPPGLFLRETPLTQADAAIAELAREEWDSAKGNVLDVLHGLLARLHSEVVFDTKATDAATPAAEAFARRRGVCQDLSHIFIAAARSLGVPTRYVGGHFHRGDGADDQPAGHAWAEAHVPGLGWVAFDVANGVCATDAHVRVATGLDYLGAAPVRGIRIGGGAEALAVEVTVEQGAGQRQS